MSSHLRRTRTLLALAALHAALAQRPGEEMRDYYKRWQKQWAAPLSREPVEGVTVDVYEGECDEGCEEDCAEEFTAKHTSYLRVHYTGSVIDPVTNERGPPFDSSRDGEPSTSRSARER